VIVAFSGGKDSTALALALKERGENVEGLLFTPTGDEYDDVGAHVERAARFIGAPLIFPEAPTLYELIEDYNALPNHRMRWCTRKIKIEPCERWLHAHPGTTLAVGLRADEETRVGAIYKAPVNYVTPMRDWGWDIEDVWDYLEDFDVEIPSRTDCKLCFWQRLEDWRSLWEYYPEDWERGEYFEELTGHTFRSPSRDTWPASMRELGEEFASGRPLRKSRVPRKVCRVCSW
jgi:PP-loop superfamily ATP-utilizing enzyme